ncbi:hypothetical protein [Rothia sp. P4278]|uniref:hypothetical protein n=1 Tax=Rothia sp. P4278 TaxID=3402658 RepID=UPI003AEAFEA3
MDGYSNLTQAIQDGVRIDWEQLDGRPAKCVHPEMGTLTQKMERIQNDDPSNYLAWTNESIVWEWAFELAWQNASGWSLWVESEIPVELLTADELEPGTGFLGKDLDSGTKGNWITYRVDADPIRAKLIDAKLQEIDAPADEIEVIEVYGIGTLQAPKEEA